MKKLRYVILLLVIICSGANSFAQLNPIKEFSVDPLKFLEEVKVMFEATNMEKKDIKEFVESFALAWNSPECNDNLKKSIVGTCNLMIKKKLRILPEYKSYLTSVKNFINSDQSETNFLTWQECINKILAGKVIRNFSDYLEMSENLFESNSFYNSSVIRFSSNNNKYIFEYDSVPKVIFPSMNMRIANNQNDTGIVYNTKGVYYPFRGLFIGEGGKVNWKRAGIEDNVVWAELKKYQISLKTSGFVADSVVFYNKNYFQKPLIGQLTEKIVSEKEQNISYPRFESYNKRMPIPNIAKDVDYEGGFS
ncbi:MAG: hypothetical protein H0X46_08590, partial [Bacteroidetes bacterium]|nr:hypothetical protein [Bacteroidota bacterium]